MNFIFWALGINFAGWDKLNFILWALGINFAGWDTK